MRRSTASLAFVLLLGVSLSAKGLGFERADEAARQDAAAPAIALLEQRGFAVEVPDRKADPVWVVGRRGACQLRVAEVSPQGWHRTAVAEQAAGQWLRFAFDGQLHRDQPVLRTKAEDYRRRLLRYLGLPAPAPAVRAVVLGPGCPEDTIGPQEADFLSR